MTSRMRMKAALRVVQDGRPSRARANKFGWAEAALAQKMVDWNRALKVLERHFCGARRRRDGKPCRALNVPGRDRCKWHGGMSTGPRTPEGKARALANLRQNRQG